MMMKAHLSCDHRQILQVVIVFIFFSSTAWAQTGKSAHVKELPPSSDRWALVVGIGKYDDPHLNGLFGENDATRIAADLKAYAAFPADQVILLSNNEPADHQPTRERILYWLSIIKQNASPQGLILIAYSGHGMVFQRHSFLMPKDLRVSSDPIYVTQSALDADLISGSLRDHPDPANEGHMKSGQRERLIPIREMMWKTGPRPLDRNSPRRFRPSPHPQLLLQLSQKPCPRQRTTEDLFKGNRQRQRTRQISEKSVGRILPDPRWLVFR